MSTFPDDGALVQPPFVDDRTLIVRASPDPLAGGPTGSDDTPQATTQSTAVPGSAERAADRVLSPAGGSLNEAPGESNRTSYRWVGGLAGVAAVAVGVALFLHFGGSGDDGAVLPAPGVIAAAASTSTVPSSTVTVTVVQTTGASVAPSPVHTPNPDVVALAQLKAQAATDGARVPLDGQWFAQLASKYVGITDPLQTNARGSHTFRAADVWAEYESILSQVGQADLFLLDSRTFGKRFSHDGEALWVVGVQDTSFVDKESVTSWCGDLYPSLTGDDLRNVCMPNRLNP